MVLLNRSVHAHTYTIDKPHPYAVVYRLTRNSDKLSVVVVHS